MSGPIQFCLELKRRTKNLFLPSPVYILVTTRWGPVSGKTSDHLEEVSLRKVTCKPFFNTQAGQPIFFGAIQGNMIYPLELLQKCSRTHKYKYHIRHNWSELHPSPSMYFQAGRVNCKSKMCSFLSILCHQ